MQIQLACSILSISAIQVCRAIPEAASAVEDIQVSLTTGDRAITEVVRLLKPCQH